MMRSHVAAEGFGVKWPGCVWFERVACRSGFTGTGVLAELVPGEEDESLACTCRILVAHAFPHLGLNTRVMCGAP